MDLEDGHAAAAGTGLRSTLQQDLQERSKSGCHHLVPPGTNDPGSRDGSLWRSGGSSGRFWAGPGRGHTYLEGGGAVGEVHAGDEPAVGRRVGRPQPVVKVVAVWSEVKLEGTTSHDLVDQPDTAPVAVVQNRADKNRLLLAPQGGGVYEDQMS